jgi:hypothetical protein
MDDLGLFGLERALAACLFCAKGMASRDPKAEHILRSVIALLESAHDELANPAAAQASA